MALTIKKEDQTKAIVLGSATGVVFLIAIIRTVGAINANNTAAAPTASSPPATGATLTNTGSQPPASSGGIVGVGTTAASATAQMPDNAVRLNDLYADSAPPMNAVVRDPFTPVAPSGNGSPVASAVPTRRYPLVPRPRTQIESGMGPGTRTGRSGGFAAVPAANPLPSFRGPGTGAGTFAGAGAGLDAPKIALNGIILGEPSMAVLTVGSRPYELSVGQKLPQGYKVARISDNGVYLTKGKKTYYVEVGRALSSPTPTGLPMAPAMSASRAALAAYDTAPKKQAAAEVLPPDKQAVSETLPPSDKNSTDFALHLEDAGLPPRLSDLRGKVVLLDFWATWCGPCRQSIPALEAIYKKYKDQGLEVIGISVDDASTRAKVSSARDQLGFTYPILFASDNPEIRAAYSFDAIPTLVCIDKQGKIRISQTGYSPSDNLEGKIAGLLNE